MPKTHSDPLSQLVQDIVSSNKYRDICPDLITAIGGRELAKRRTLKEAIKATKNKLHQVGGAYFSSTPDYARWISELDQARTQSPEVIKQVCRTIMAHHASTRERLPILDQFYSTIFAQLPPINSILDLACGLNPLAIPWMSLESHASYRAYDIYQPAIDFLDTAMQTLGIDGSYEARDITQSPPTQYADLALLLKTLPCLEQLDKQASTHLLHTINARYLLVSFPVHSLGGKNKGMGGHYEAHFRELLGSPPWEMKKFEFATELAFLVKKEAIHY